MRPLVLNLHIPYCIKPEKYHRSFCVVGSNEEKDAYLAAMKRELLSWEGEL